MSSILIRPAVQITPTIAAVLHDLEPFAEAAGVVLTVTSGLRDPNNQLRLIAAFASDHGISYPEFDGNDPHKSVFVAALGRSVYAWQRTWSSLLRNVDKKKDPCIVINPPLAAECLEDYIRPDGSNAKGVIIPGSPHGSGKCFDEQADGNLKDQVDEIPKKVAVLEKAKAAGVAIKGWRVERNNNAIHVDCA